MSDKKDLSKNQLKLRIKQLEDEYDVKVGKIPAQKIALERAEYTPLSEDEILSVAEKSLADKYGAKKQSLKEQTAQKTKSFEQAIALAQKQAEETAKRREKDFDDAGERLEEQAIKRGIGRSSVVLGELGQLEEQKQEMLAEIDKTANTAVADYSGKIEQLQQDLSKSLAELDMQKAVEISAEIDEIRKKQQEEKNAIISQNNKAVLDEAKFNKSVDESKNAKVVASLNLEKNKQIMNEIVRYYREFGDKEQALADFLSDEELKATLGKYYDIVLNEIKNF